ncbi:MAG: hypothetical protein U0K71_10345, partial [Paludibacteraceae bacterium]|nr:hypothetical protein [Paludibacteraceae bacterium]
YVVSDNDFTSIDVLNSQDNGYSIVNITSKFPGWVEINGVEFRGQSCVPRASSSAVQILGYNVSGVNTRIEKCSFVGNYAAIYSGCDTTIIEECLFDSLDYCGLSVSSFSLSENNYLLVDKTTFANSLYQLSASSFRGLMRVQNSTFANALYGVTTPLDFMSTPENTKIEIYNNSFFSGKKGDCSLLVYDYIPVELKGNIISSKKLIVKPDQNGKYESKPIVSDYNVYTTEIDAYPLGENDTIVPQSSIGEIVKGVVENDIFEASLEDEGLYVKKLPTLINVKFEKGGGIKKMSKNATPVTDDQIGEIRSEVDYCVGAIEADCEFKKANFKLELAEEEICRDDTAKVTLTGLTKKEKATYKFAWTSSKDSVYVVDTFGNPGSFHVYARQALVPLQMTITNVCGVDTVLEIMQKVNGVGSVPFDGIEEGEVFCQNESEPVKLTTAVEGAIFTGECVVKKTDGYYFDASKAKGDSTRVRCSIQDGDCRSFDEKTIHFFKFDGDEAVEILASTQTKNVCMEKPQAQSVFTVTGWRDGLTCRLNGLASTLMDSTVTKDSVLTVTYGSLKNGEYIFVVSDECKPIASETIKIENEEIDPDMLKLSLDTVVANTQTCDGGEFGDVRVEYSGNINKADVVVVLSSLGTMVK